MTGSDKITFGKYKGTKLDNVPASYLLWLSEQEWLELDHPGLAKYIAENLDAIEEEDYFDDPNNDPYL